MHLSLINLGFPQNSYRRDFDLRVVYREKEGLAPVEVCPWSMMLASRASLCKWMPFSGHSSWYFCFRLWRLGCSSRREISSGTSSSSSSSGFGHKEFKVGSEYTVNMFNGFINAWFDYWFWQVSISYDYAVLRMIKEKFFLVFLVLPFFQNKHKKNKVGIETTLFINDGKYLKQRTLNNFTFVSSGMKGFFLKNKKTTNKHIIWTRE